jgi:hypothetical protein
MVIVIIIVVVSKMLKTDITGGGTVAVVNGMSVGFF